MKTISAKLDINGFVFASFGKRLPSEVDDISEEIADDILDEIEQERKDSLQFVRELFSELIETS